MAVAAVSCSDDDAPGGAADSDSGDATTGGGALETAARVTLYAADNGDQASTLATGDFNGDGARDVAFGAAFADGPENSRADGGEVYVFLGPFAGDEVRDAAAGDASVTVYGAQAGEQAGRGLAAGDFNGDGADDLVIGAPFADGPDGTRAGTGRVDIVFGAPSLGSASRTMDLAAGAGLSVHGASPGDLAGFALATGNLNGDTATDLLIGAFYAGGPDDSRPLAGEVYAILGGARAGQLDLAATPPDVLVYGATDEDRLGEGLAAGDVNGDGLDDLLLPAPFAPSLADIKDAGRTYVIHSPAPAVIDLASATVAATIYGGDDGDQLGHITAAKDMDGDGSAEILLTAVSADGPGNTVNLSGEVGLVRSRSLRETLDAAAGDLDAVIYGAAETNRLGRSAALGDIDGDGRYELILGSPGSGAPGGEASQTGAIWVMPADDLEREQRLPEGALVLYGADTGDALSTEIFGRNPLVATDMNGDGSDEILVAAALAEGPHNSRADCGEAMILFITQTSQQ